MEKRNFVNFATILKSLRKENNLTQDEIAKKIGLTRQSIAAYEKGIREPNFKLLIKIADFFDVSVDYLFCRVKSSEKDVYTIGKNIKIIRDSKSYGDFARDIGNKTGVYISPERLSLYETFKLKPKRGELLLLSKYSDIEIDFFYKNNTKESYLKCKKYKIKNIPKFNFDNVDFEELNKWLNNTDNLEYIIFSKYLKDNNISLETFVYNKDILNS
jgi:transcriptional regulator with XRE-family HTH domain